MNTLAVSELIASLVMLAVSIVILVRWWGMTNDVKEIKRLLMQQRSEVKLAVNTIEERSTAPSSDDIEALKKKMKKNQCVVFVKATERTEIWDRTDWEEVEQKGRANRFDLIYCNWDL